MAAYRTYSRLDDPVHWDGDTRWRGVDARHQPGALEAGACAEAVNMRFTDGSAESRRGIRMMPWGDGVPTQGVATRGMAYTTGGASSDNLGTAIRSRVYVDPETNQEWIVTLYKFPDGHLAITRACSGNQSRTVEVDQSVIIADDTQVDMVQTHSGMVMLFNDRDPLYLHNWSVGFTSVPTAPTGLTRAPAGNAAIYFQNRLCIVSASTDPAERDSVWVGNVGTARDALYGDNALKNYFKVNVGSQDRLVGLFPLNDTTLLAAKQGSIHVLSGIYGDNSQVAATARAEVLTTEFGCASARSFVQVGGDVWFLSPRRGVMSVRATAEGRNLGLSVPVSQPMQDRVARVNWARANEACADTWGNRVYYAVPVGSADFEVWVYDTQQQAWSGYDQSNALQIVDWVRFTWNGERRLGFTHSVGPVMLYEEGSFDDVLSVQTGVM